MENIRSYEDMKNYVRKVIDNSWDFLFSCNGNMYMFVSIEGTHERYVSYARWLAGDKAEAETRRKAVLEAVSMQYSTDLEDVEMSDRFFARVRDNEDDFWETEYMAALDEPETEWNIKKLAADLWKQWKEYELDE